MKLNTSNSVMALATTFADKGDWTVEQQFVLQMGSSYLLAHGIGTPLQKDAVTTVTVPCDGEYNILVRTKNWTKHWSDGPTPGIFSVLIDGQSDGTTYGTDSVNWYWQRGGKVALTAGEHTIALHDLTGFDGRCDAVILTTEDYVPSESLEEYFALREALLGAPVVKDKGNYDFVVVGGGISGICAALAASRPALTASAAWATSSLSTASARSCRPSATRWAAPSARLPPCLCRTPSARAPSSAGWSPRPSASAATNTSASRPSTRPSSATEKSSSTARSKGRYKI